MDDPANWDSASYLDDPIDHIEPLELAPNPYRERALDCLDVLKCVDEFMSRASDSRLAWVGISVALDLCSTSGQTAAELAHQMGISERRLNNSTARFLKLAGFDPSSRGLAPWL